MRPPARPFNSGPFRRPPPNGRTSPGLGNYHWGIKPPQQGGMPTTEGQLCAPEVEEQQKGDPRAIASIQRAAQRTFFHNRLSPIDAPPYQARYPDLFARAVIDVPSSPGNSAATTGSNAIANAEAAISGQSVSVLTPSSTTNFVSVLTYTVPKKHALVVKGVGTWGHDYRAIRDAILWRVRGGRGGYIASERELGLLGSLDSPAPLHGVLTESQQLVVEARNLDTASGSLIEVKVLAWVFPVVGNEDTLEALLDPRAASYRIRPRDLLEC